MGYVASIYNEQLSHVVQPKLLYFQPNHTFGDGDRIERIQKEDGSINYVLSIGSGDCPAGCINRIFYPFNLYPGSKGFKVEKVPPRVMPVTRSVADGRNIP